MARMEKVREIVKKHNFFSDIYKKKMNSHLHSCNFSAIFTDDKLSSKNGRKKNG